MINIQPVFDSVLVEVDYEWRSEVKTKSGVIGVVFESDMDRSIGAQRKGRVVRVPRKVSPDHHYLGLVDTEVKEGDTIYFHFNAVTEDSRAQVSIHEKMYHVVHMESIFCIVRNGEIIMFGDRVLCEPVYDEDIVTLDDGMKVKKSASGIITEINVSHNMKRARLSHTGRGLKDRPPVNARPGEIIYYDVDADFENEIEGKIFFCMTAEDLLMKEL